MDKVNVMNKNIYVELYGDTNQKALLYLHGGPGASCLDFHNQAISIGRTHKVIAIDQYGVLRSDAIPVDEKYGMEIQIDMLEQIRIQLNITQWSLLGHSYGGMLACLYANLHPDSVSSVIYECPSFNFAISTKSVAQYLYKHFINTKNLQGVQLCNEIQKKVYKDNDITAVNDMISVLSLASDDKKVRNYLYGISYEQYVASYSTEGITNDMWAKGELHFNKLVEDKKIFSNFLPLLDQNNQPALLITGKYDPACSEEQIDYFINHSPNAYIKEFKNSGHFPRIEEATEYTKCVCDFISIYAKWAKNEVAYFIFFIKNVTKENPYFGYGLVCFDVYFL